MTLLITIIILIKIIIKMIMIMIFFIITIILFNFEKKYVHNLIFEVRIKHYNL